jgi:uncharacterized protein YeaO (DUF488 family)
VKLYTSYYAHQSKNGDTVPVAISLKIPEWYGGNVYRKLAPKPRTLMLYKSGDIDCDEYAKQYYSLVLNQLQAIDVYKELSKFGTSVALLCYEKAHDFCHRRLVADWLERELTITVPEFGYSCSIPKIF